MKTVKISKKYITSYFEKEDLDIFTTELFIYLLGQQKKIGFIPKLIDYDCSKLVLKTENVGITLEEYCESEGDLDDYLPQIKKIYNKFIKLFLIKIIKKINNGPKLKNGQTKKINNSLKVLLSINKPKIVMKYCSLLGTSIGINEEYMYPKK